MAEVTHTPSIQVEVGDIVQANPEVCEWGPALVVVSEIKSWGIQGFTSIPRGGEAYIRLQWAEIEPTGGKAVWMPR